MSILKFKRDVLKITGEIFEEKDADISHIDFIDGFHSYSIKVLIRFKKQEKTYGFSYECCLDCLEYAVKEFEYKLNNIFNELNRKK